MGSWRARRLNLFRDLQAMLRFETLNEIVLPFIPMGTTLPPYQAGVGLLLLILPALLDTLIYPDLTGSWPDQEADRLIGCLSRHRLLPFGMALSFWGNDHVVDVRLSQ